MQAHPSHILLRHGAGSFTVHRPQIADRVKLVARARMLAWLGIAWHVAEATIAIAAGLAASSIALIGFGADSED
jgi:hypothetical protein